VIGRRTTTAGRAGKPAPPDGKADDAHTYEPYLDRGGSQMQWHLYRRIDDGVYAAAIVPRDAGGYNAR